MPPRFKSADSLPSACLLFLYFKVGPAQPLPPKSLEVSCRESAYPVQLEMNKIVNTPDWDEKAK
jgi:hypothetical protein